MPLQMTFEDIVLKREVRNWTGAIEVSTQDVMRLDDKDGNARFSVASQSKRGVRFLVSIRPPKEAGDVISTFVKWAADCNCQYVDRRGDWCKHIGGCFLSLRGVSRHAGLLQPIQKRTPRKIVNYRSVNARAVAASRPYPIQDTGAVRDIPPLRSFSAIQDATMAFNQVPMTQLRPVTGLRPRRVEFDDATLSPERIKELKSRASRSVQERERRSLSRTEETVCPQADVRPVEPEAPPAKEGNGSIGEVLELLDAKGLRKQLCVW